MSTFNSTFISRWPRPKVITMAKELGLKWQGSVRKQNILIQIDGLARRGEQENQTVWNTYHRLKGDQQPEKPGVSEDVVKQMVQKELAGTIAGDALRAKLNAMENRISDLSGMNKDTDKIREAVLQSVNDIVREEVNKFKRIEIKPPKPIRPRKIEGRVPPIFQRMVELASQRVNIYMVGPTGSGKTYLAGKLAEALGMEFSAISCSAGMSESKLEGKLLPTGKAGAFEYWPSSFVERYENGGVFLFDEIDRADANTMTFLNSALANDFFFVENRFENPLVERHKDFVCIAAGNTYGQGADAEYVGAEQLDAATLNRFAVGMVEVGYDKLVEESIVAAFISDGKKAKELLDFCWKIREAVEAHNIRRPIGTRTIQDLARMSSSYPDQWNSTVWMEQIFMGWSKTEKSKVVNALATSYSSGVAA